MKAFCQKHEAKIAGALSCLDRMLFRGYLPIIRASMAQFLKSEPVNCGNLKQFFGRHGAAVEVAWRAAGGGGRAAV
jgi:hypothetical protein